MRPAITILMLMLMWLPLGAAPADVYRSVDAQGHVQYSDVPSPGAELISAGDSSSSSPADASKASGSADKVNQQISQRLAGEAAARAVQKDAAQAHAEQCKQAQDTYQKAIQARRLFRTGTDGAREYLSDAEADQERVNYRLAMEAACQDEDTAP